MSDPNRLLTMMSIFVCLVADHENNKFDVQLSYAPNPNSYFYTLMSFNFGLLLLCFLV
jgi:hypothetical protein